GHLNRKHLREIIFHDDTKRHWLENLLHPLIFNDMKKHIDSSHSPYCIAVIPLLCEVEVPITIDKIIVVDADKDLQIDRLMARDNIGYAKALLMLQTQVPSEIRLARADYVIVNDGSEDHLKKQVLATHKEIIHLC
ncbi:unnamed protein product, partial [marine sediment metagenome]